MQHRDRWERIAWALVGLGIVIRLARYLLAFPLWGDECMLAQNFLERGYAEILRPLDNYQVAPPLFLMLELTAVKLFGFSEWSLRLLGLASGIGALLVFKHLAGRLLRGPSYVLAVGLLAVSFYPMRHSAEVKPYASDLLVSVVLTTMAVRWWQNRQNTRWLWALAAVMPVAVGLSFPAVFVAGAISLLLAYELLRSRQRMLIFPAVAYFGSLAASAAALMALSAGSQLEQWGPSMRHTWVAAFPPSITEPLRLLRWLAETYTGPMFAYPLGAKAGGSAVTTICFVVGLVAFIRRGDRLLAALLSAPFLIGLAGSVVRLYPYGDNERIVQYLGPAICLFAGRGTVQLLARLAHAQRRMAMIGVIGLLVLIGSGESVYDLVHPYKHRCDWEHQSFARWFWNQDTDIAELVAMPYAENAAAFGQTDYSGYLCYQRIFGRRLKSLKDVAHSSNRAIDCVVFHNELATPNQSQLDAWLKQFEPHYRLAGCTRHRVKLDVAVPRDYYGDYDVYRFEPRRLSEEAAQNAVPMRK